MAPCSVSSKSGSHETQQGNSSRSKRWSSWQRLQPRQLDRPVRRPCMGPAMRPTPAPKRQVDRPGASTHPPRQTADFAALNQHPSIQSSRTSRQQVRVRVEVGWHWPGGSKSRGDPEEVQQ
eukprot:1159208-Pelagomonas_calceolata.AAC.1